MTESAETRGWLRRNGVGLVLGSIVPLALAVAAALYWMYRFAVGRWLYSVPWIAEALRPLEPFREKTALIPRLVVGAGLLVLFLNFLVLYLARVRRRMREARPARRAEGSSLFLVSFLILFVELAAIRWFPAYVVFLTFFSNFVLMAAFVGMSIGCLAARRRANLVNLVSPLTFVAVLASAAVFLLASRLHAFNVQIGNVQNPEHVFFGTTFQDLVAKRPGVPVEGIIAVFFILIALIFVGLGQELGRSLNRFENRIKAYAINLAGSLVGIVAFTVMSYLSTPPVWWFLIAFVCLLWFVRGGAGWVLTHAGLLAVSLLAIAGIEWALGTPHTIVHWSPYYNIRYMEPPSRAIIVNTIGHQEMYDRTKGGIAYSLPYLLRKNSGGAPIRDVLIIGAGSGNDAAHALWHGVQHVDAVEIDPLIARLGRQDHPNSPYSDPRVNLIIGDGRNVLKNTPHQYDLIVYALVDSLTLHSTYSSVRLESFLFTRQAMEDVKSKLKPGGIFVAYNQFREGWIVTRLRDMLASVFNQDPIVIGLPSRAEIVDSQEYRGQALLIAGNIDGIRRAFDTRGPYTLDLADFPRNLALNGFGLDDPPDTNVERVYPARIVEENPNAAATDDWPFFYLKKRLIPWHNLVGLGIIVVLSFLILLTFAPVRTIRFNPHFMFLGAGFMLVETNSIIRLALLFGSTWLINSVVFFTILVMSLLASLYVLVKKPTRMRWYYVALAAALVLNLTVDLGRLLALTGAVKLVASCVLVFLPILFAGVIFSSSFRRSANPDADFGANIAGTVVGGVLEYLSLITGYRMVLVIVLALYALSLIGLKRLRGKVA